MSKSEQMKQLLTKGGINVTALAILGAWVHVDTFKKYEHQLRNAMFAGGFKCVKVSDGPHMDGADCFRMVFKVVG